MAQLKNKLERLDAKQPNEITGRHVFLQQLAIALKAKSDASGVQSPIGSYRGILRLHGRRWAMQTPEMKATYEGMAKALQKEKAEVQEADRQTTIAALRVRRTRPAHRPVSLNLHT